MKVTIQDKNALIAVSPANLSAYARSVGWVKSEPYGDHSDVYINESLPEIILPRTKGLGDYAHVVSQLIEIFAKVEDRSQLDVFCDVLKAGSEEAQELVEEIYEQKKRAEEALQEVRWNPSAFPLDQAIANAISLQETGKIEEAIEKWRSIANIAEEIDNDLAAHAWFSIGCLLSEDDVEVDEENNIQEAISVYDRALSLKPDFAEAYTNRGIAKGVLGQTEAAIADFDRALSLNPDDAEVYYNQGSAKFVFGDYEAAITNFDRAIHLKPDYIEAYSYRGIAKSIIKQPKAAIADFDQVIHLNPDDAEAYYNRGIVKRVLGDYEAVIADFDRAIHLKPDLAKAYSHRGIAKGNLGDYEAAVVDFDQAIRLNPDDVEAYYNRGIANFVLGEYQAAITDDDQVIYLESDYAEAYYNRGLARLVLDEYQAAVVDFDQAIRLNPDYAEAYYNRGNAKRALGDDKAAIADFDRAVRLNPDDPLAYYNRGNANAILNRLEKARADFETALELAIRSENTALKFRIEQQLQGLMNTVSVSSSIRKTKDLLRSQLDYDPVKETLSDFNSPVVTRLPIQRALVEL